MTTAEPATRTDEVVTQRARVYTLVQRRKRLWRRLAVFVVVAVVMILAALHNRDTQQLRVERKKGRVVATVLQEEYSSRLGPPLMFPSTQELSKERKRYYFNMFYDSQGKVGVCCLKKPVRFFVRTDGRIVILFDGEHFNSQWMPESEFRTKAKDLGFGDVLKK